MLHTQFLILFVHIETLRLCLHPLQDASDDIRWTDVKPLSIPLFVSPIRYECPKCGFEIIHWVSLRTLGWLITGRLPKDTVPVPKEQTLKILSDRVARRLDRFDTFVAEVCANRMLDAMRIM
jgi:hypothetical protein